jgi:sulfite exporter TauE/SafE
VSVTSVFLTGLLAGGASCAAVQGGLLAGLVARQRDTAAQPAGSSTSQQRGSARPSARKSAKRPEPPRPAREVLADDLAPVSGFLGGKLVSHTVLGAALGALGGAVQFGSGTRAAAQITAGVLMVILALAQLGVPGFRRFTIEPPAAWTRLVRARARSSSAFAPAVLGVATVLIPCGVTLSVELLAVASGSPLVGAATMAVFVLGTAPLFAVLGYAARRAASVLNGRLAIATGVVVLVVGLVTVNTGLAVAGSPVTAARAWEALGVSSRGAQVTAADSQGRVRVKGGRQTVVLDAREGAYVPDALTAVAGLPTTLLVRTKGTRGCVRALVIPGVGKETILPETGETRIDLGMPRAGRLDYACGMGMYTGQITFTRAAPTPSATTPSGSSSTSKGTP